MDLREFERGYAERSGLTIDRLHALGLRGEPCDCDYEKCEGWQMFHGDDEAREGPFYMRVIDPQELTRDCGNQAFYQCILYALFAVIGACFGAAIWAIWITG